MQSSGSNQADNVENDQLVQVQSSDAHQEVTDVVNSIDNKEEANSIS